LPQLSGVLAKKYETLADKVLEGITLEWAPAKDRAELVRTFLNDFVRRAYRRPARSEEVDELIAVYAAGKRNGAGFTESLKAALRQVLASPHFVYRIETPAAPDQIELASRLSYFLWSSMPDRKLLARAESERLNEGLETETKRMLRDPKSAALAENFGRFWLELPKLDDAWFVDEALRSAMQSETELFLAHVVHNDRPVLELLDADYTFLNDRLAGHYGISGVHGPNMDRVALADGRRGGLLTQASVLTITSEYKSTAPVRRGKWILDNILGTPPRARPRSLPATRPPGLSGTRREILERHRTDPSCVHCHAQMEALGFTLEHFDETGAWRALDDNRRPIDAAVTLPGGKFLDGPAHLKTYVLERSQLFVRCLRGKLLAYALGRKLTDRDLTDLHRSATAEPIDRFSRIIGDVVRCGPFQMPWWEGDAREIRTAFSSSFQPPAASPTSTKAGRD
jgi:hypothetical protein